MTTQTIDKMQLVEAILFTVGDVFDRKKLQSIADVDKKELQQIIEKLNKAYTRHKRSFRIYQLTNGYQMRTIPELSPWLGQLDIHKKFDLSPKILETLAIVAYKQPITKAEIDVLRGVDSYYTIQQLLTYKLIKIAGRSTNAGNSLLYKTTKNFLNQFSLKSIKDLPRINEIEDLGLTDKPLINN